MHLGGDTSGCTLPLEFLLSNWWSWAWDPPHGCWWRPYKSGVESCTKFTPPPFMPFPRNSPPKTHPNNKRINHFFVVMCISMLFYILQVLIPGQILRLDDIGTARLAIFLSCITCLPLFTLSWQYLFRDKPPVARIPIGQNLLSAGFRKLYRTYKELSTDNRAVQIFLVGIAWSEAADTALATIATTFMSEFLKMNSLEIGMALLVVLIAGIPGTMLGDFICKVPKYASFNTFW
jgi:Vacuole effluxer Atg22 like